MMYLRGKLISFSGIDGAGKSTQISLLIRHLRKAGKKPVYLWTRGGYTGPFNFLKTLLRRLLGNKIPPPGKSEHRAKMFRKLWISNLWLTLALVDLVLIYGIYVRFLIISGKTVIADRYLGDTWIDFRLNFSEVDVPRWCLWKFLQWISPKPDYALLLLIPIEESLKRSKKKEEPFPDSGDVLGKRFILYQGLSHSFEGYVLDGMQPIDKIAEKIKRICEI